MTREPFRTLTSRTIVLPQENIDTDQIIPARFLTTTQQDGLGKSAFYDWRYNGDGSARADSPLTTADTQTHQILVSGANFGCGSSREHAPWALLDFGFRVVLSSDIADIFTSNALKNGLVAIEVDPETHKLLLENPGTRVSVDLENNELTVGNTQTSFTLEAFARTCLLNGVDSLGALTAHTDAIAAYEQRTGKTKAEISTGRDL